MSDPLLIFELICSKCVADLVDAATIERFTRAAFTSENIDRFMRRFGQPSRGRVVERLQKSLGKLGAWLPEPAQHALAELLGRPVHVPKRLVNDVIHSPEVRAEVHQLLQEAIDTILERSMAAAPGGKGLRGMMGLAAGAVGTVLGGVGMDSRVREYTDRAVGKILSEIARKLTSEQAARALGVRRKRLFLRLLDRHDREAGDFLDWLPVAEIEAIAPSVIHYNLARAEVLETVQAEIAAALTELSSSTIGELLDEFGLKTLAKESFLRIATSLSQELDAK